MSPRRLKLGTNVDSGLYYLYQNQASAAYSSHYFIIFLSLQLSNIKNFHHIVILAWNEIGRSAIFGREIEVPDREVFSRQKKNQF